MYGRRPLAKTCLSVYEWGEIMDVRLPELFQFLYQTRNQYFKRRRVASQTECFDEVYQFHEDAAQMSRLMVSEAIQRAEEVLADYLGFWPCRKYIECEEVPYLPPFTEDTYHDYYLEPGLTRVHECCDTHPERDNIYLLRTRYGNVQRVGIRTEVLVQEDVPITTYASIPGSTIHDAWTATVTVPSGTLERDVNIYVGASSRGQLPREDWFIDPVSVEIDTTTDTATIYGSRLLTPTPNNLIGYDVGPLTLYDPLDTTTHIDSIDVYVYQWNAATENCVNGYFIRDHDCDDIRQSACINVYNNRAGYFFAYPVDYIVDEVTGDTECNQVRFSSTCEPYNKIPDKVCVSYESGCCPDCDDCQNCTHAKTCKRMIAILATSFLTCFPCDCNCGGCGDRLQKYSEPAKFDTQAGILNLQALKGENVPSNFGYTMGGLIAWDMAKRLKIGKGLLVP